MAPGARPRALLEIRARKCPAESARKAEGEGKGEAGSAAVERVGDEKATASEGAHVGPDLISDVQPIHRARVADRRNVNAAATRSRHSREQHTSSSGAPRAPEAQWAASARAKMRAVWAAGAQQIEERAAVTPSGHGDWPALHEHMVRALTTSAREAWPIEIRPTS